MWGGWVREMSSMSCEPIVTCTYGWGRSARLYQDVVTLGGRLYELVELENVQARYHRFLGLASARLILRFQNKEIILRGIADVAVARRMEAYLDAYLQEHLPATPVPAPLEDDAQFDLVLSSVQEQAFPFDLTSVPVSEKGHPLSESSSESVGQFWEYGPTHADVAANAITEAQMVAEALTEELAMGSGEATREEPSRWKRQRELQERRRLRLRRLREERVVREHGFDVLALALRLRTEILPVVEVPASLLAGEVAHYRTEAMLCGEPLTGAMGRGRNRYRIKDQGILILTSQRLLYLGRQRQIALSYERLREVSRTHRAVSFLAEGWGRCQLFEVRRPLEVTMYLECILQRYASPPSDDSDQESSRIVPTTPSGVWSSAYEREIMENAGRPAGVLHNR
jgi:hypothetical protein